MSKPTLIDKAGDLCRHNIPCARIILNDRQRYSGIQVEWAESIIRKEQERAARKNSQSTAGRA